MKSPIGSTEGGTGTKVGQRRCRSCIPSIGLEEDVGPNLGEGFTSSSLQWSIHRQSIRLMSSLEQRGAALTIYLRST